MKESLFDKGKNFYRKLGPGLVTGASDDDPSGILTYLQSGAVLGFGVLWTVLLTLPLMYTVQEMCGRIGLVSDKGLIKLIKENYAKFWVYFIALISVLAITVNIAANLLAGGLVLEIFTGVGRIFWIFVLGGIILYFMIFFSYQRFARVMKWFAYFLLFYILAVFYMKIDWWGALKATISPEFVFTKDSILLLTAILGTTISPYLFFWQANEEAEQRDEETKGRALKRFAVTKRRLRFLEEDTFLGMLVSNVTMWFIMVGAGYIGVSKIVNFEDASLALQPLLGPLAFLAFGLGIIGTSFLAIPVLAGGVGYAFAEVFGWNEGIGKPFRQTRGFYLAVVASVFAAIIISLVGFDPINLLIYAAVFYALITPFLIFMIMRMANDKKIMGNKVNSYLSNFFGGIAFLVTLVAAFAYFIVQFVL